MFNFFKKIKDKIKFRVNSEVIINGVKIKTIDGDNEIIVDNEEVYVNGEKIEEIGNHQKIEIIINGDCDFLETANGDVEVKGSVGELKINNGDVIVK